MRPHFLHYESKIPVDKLLQKIAKTHAAAKVKEENFGELTLRNNSLGPSNDKTLKKINSSDSEKKAQKQSYQSQVFNKRGFKITHLDSNVPAENCEPEASQYSVNNYGNGSINITRKRLSLNV